MEAEAFLIGHWKNFDELEENLTLEELTAIINAARDREYERNKFTAALKGIDLEAQSEQNVKERFLDIKRKAEGMAAGKTGLEADVYGLGLGVELEEEE